MDGGLEAKIQEGFVFLFSFVCILIYSAIGLIYSVPPCFLRRAIRPLAYLVITYLPYISPRPCPTSTCTPRFPYLIHCRDPWLLMSQFILHTILFFSLHNFLLSSIHLESHTDAFSHLQWLQPVSRSAPARISRARASCALQYPRPR